ncbi:protein TBATA isoform X2 [Tachyglossus aculeatus]|uniref:protein TBATA isoform X2 n=1 Tax=Tachyglossus aculeatus TaxID=9261 RepID=UPI0018F6A7FC|nr:protein TBATA isoform X2 [Tachyglossus aculeatus]
MATEGRSPEPFSPPQVADKSLKEQSPGPGSGSGSGPGSSPLRRKEAELLREKLDLMVPPPSAPRPPPSQSASRFGRLSHHSFFSRHNPHPHRVTHIQGLSGHPICVVKDDWLDPASPLPRLPSQLMPSLMGVPEIQRPIGDPRSNLEPWLPTGSLSEAWREALRELAIKVASFVPKEAVKEEEEEEEEREERRRMAQYSADTGRLIPASSRAITSRARRLSRRPHNRNKNQGPAMLFQDQELLILELLCQILRTDSLKAIQYWLLSAGPREKDLVLELLHSAVAHLLPRPQAPGPEAKERLLTQISQQVVGLASRGHTLGHCRQASLYAQIPKQAPPPADEKPDHIGQAEILQFHSTQEESKKLPSH